MNAPLRVRRDQAGWPRVRLGELAEHRLGKMLDKAKNTGVPRRYLRNPNVRWFDVDLSDLQEILVEEKDVHKYELRAGDVVICEGGEAGRAALWKGEDDGIIFQKACHRVRVGPRLDARFLIHRLMYDYFNGGLEDYYTGATIKHFTGQDLARYEIPLPPIDEQLRIAAILDKADALRRKRTRAVDLLDELTQSIFLTMFADEICDQHSKAFRTIAEVSALQNGAYFPADNYSKTREGVEMVHMSDAFYGTLKRGGLKRVKCKPSDIERYRLLDTDLIVARRSLNIEGAAKPCLIPTSREPLIFESSFIRLRLDPTLVRATYMYHYLSNGFVRDVYLNPYITQSTISGINQSNLGKVRVLVPSLSRQDKFINVARQIDASRARMKMLLQHHDDLFASLQSRAFSGQL